MHAADRADRAEPRPLPTPPRPLTEVVRYVVLVDAVLLVALLTVAGVLALSLVRGALRHWCMERAGCVYDLPVDYRGAALRGAAAVLVVALTAVAVAALLPDRAEWRQAMSAGTGPPGPPGPPGLPGTAEAQYAPSPPYPPAGGAGRTGKPAGGASSGGKRTEGTGRTGEPSGGARLGPPRTIGPAFGGTLRRYADGTRVWLPPGYTRAVAAPARFPVVVAHLGSGAAQPSRLSDLVTAFAGESARGRAHAFILVVPPACGPDTGPLLRAVATHHRTATGRHGRAVLGLGHDSSCAVAAALRHPERYRAAAALATSTAGGPGRGEGHAHRSAVTVPALRSAVRPSLLLAATVDNQPARAEALRLRTTLAGHADTRIVDTVPGTAAPSGASLQRAALFAVAAGYLTEKLTGPVAAASPTPRSADPH